MTTEEMYAAKIEVHGYQLGNEKKMLTQLKRVSGVPKVHRFRHTENQTRIIIMDLLGKSLVKHFMECKAKFDLATVLSIGL